MAFSRYSGFFSCSLGMAHTNAYRLHFDNSFVRTWLEISFEGIKQNSAHQVCLLEAMSMCLLGHMLSFVIVNVTA